MLYQQTFSTMYFVLDKLIQLDVTSETFGERLRRLREGRGFTQDQLGVAIGVSGQAIYLLETRPERRPRATTAEALARLFGVTQSYLLTGSDPMLSSEPPPFDSYLRSVTALDEDQIGHMRRTLEAMEAERQLRELRARHEPDPPSLHPSGTMGHIFTPAADSGEDLKRAENRRRYDEEQRRKREQGADDP